MIGDIEDAWARALRHTREGERCGRDVAPPLVTFRGVTFKQIKRRYRMSEAATRGNLEVLIAAEARLTERMLARRVARFDRRVAEQIYGLSEMEKILSDTGA